MFYISDIDKSSGRYAITDTSDGTTDIITSDELRDAIKEGHRVMGVYKGGKIIQRYLFDFMPTGETLVDTSLIAESLAKKNLDWLAEGLNLCAIDCMLAFNGGTVKVCKDMKGLYHYLCKKSDMDGFYTFNAYNIAELLLSNNMETVACRRITKSGTKFA